MTDEGTVEGTDDEINRVSTNDRAFLNARLGTSNVRELQLLLSCAAQIMEKISSLHMPRDHRLYLLTFKCNTITSDFPRQLQCLVPPTELSTGRRWNTPRDAAADWCQRFELDGLASTQRLLSDNLQVNHIFFCCAENAKNIKCILLYYNMSRCLRGHSYL
jgi:hypothetical protein